MLEYNYLCRPNYIVIIFIFVQKPSCQKSWGRRETQRGIHKDAAGSKEQRSVSLIICLFICLVALLYFGYSVKFVTIWWYLIVPAERSSWGDYETGSVRVCVSPCVKICFFSVISWPILILFVLSDRAWWGLQNFYTEFWISLCKFVQIYSKSMKNATSLFLGRFWFCLFYLIGLGGGFKTSTQYFEIH